jgi:hypothetical protein
MMVMPSNQAGGMVHYLAGRFPGQIGWLLAPDNFKEPRRWLPYAIDNGKFAAWGNEQNFGGKTETSSEWTEDKFFDLLDRCKLSRYKPMWVAVPDEVGNKEETLWLWDHFENKIRRYGWPLAFVAQDGMKPRDVPKTADIVFIGGSTTWKWRSVAEFVASFPRVHVGRVNWVDKLEYCEAIGVESCDGTGFFKGGEDSIQGEQLQEFLAGRRRYEEQFQLFHEEHEIVEGNLPTRL